MGATKRASLRTCHALHSLVCLAPSHGATLRAYLLTASPLHDLLQGASIADTAAAGLGLSPGGGAARGRQGVEDGGAAGAGDVGSAGAEL